MCTEHTFNSCSSVGHVLLSSKSTRKQGEKVVIGGNVRETSVVQRRRTVRRPINCSYLEEGLASQFPLLAKRELALQLCAAVCIAGGSPLCREKASEKRKRSPSPSASGRIRAQSRRRAVRRRRREECTHAPAPPLGALVT